MASGESSSMNPESSWPLSGGNHPLRMARTESSPQSTSSNTATLRDYYLQIAQQRYPNIKPRNDFDLLALGSFRGEASEFEKYADKSLEFGLLGFPPEEVKDNKENVMAEIKRNITALLDTAETPTGIKPSPGEDDVHIRQIPDSDYSLRMWGKGLEAKHEYCLDFVDGNGEPVNSPFEYELWVVPNQKAPWLPLATSRLYSVEENFGMAQKDIPEGEERFMLLEGTACILKRPDVKRDVYFEAPIRERKIEFGDVDKLTF